MQKVLERHGFGVKTTRKTRDQGADLIMNKGRLKYVVQVKFYSSPIGNKAVQEVVAAKGCYGADKGMAVTNSRFTSAAVALAKSNDVELIDGIALKRLAEGLSVERCIFGWLCPDNLKQLGQGLLGGQ